MTVVLVRISTGVGKPDSEGGGRTQAAHVHERRDGRRERVVEFALIRPFGLVGVAVGTLIPVTVSAAFVLYPAACRRVGLPLSRPLTQAIVPALWPAAIMGALLWFGRHLPPGGLLGVALHAAAGGLVYAGLFLGLAIGAEERRFYWTRLRSLVARQRRTPAAI